MAALKFSWCCVNWLLLLVLMALGAEAILRPAGKETDAVQQRLTPLQCLAADAKSSATAATAAAPDADKKVRVEADAEVKAMADLLSLAAFSGQADFSVRLFQATYGASATAATSNVFLSPVSVYYALLLAYFGARAQTQAQIATVLGLNDTDKVSMANSYKVMKFQRDLAKNAGLAKYDLEIANRAYLSRHLNIRQCMSDIFADELETIDFRSDDALARQRINDWVANVTRGRIHDIVNQDNVNQQTTMALVNAAYFKGQWDSKFDKKDTKAANFSISANESVVTDFMFQKARFRHAASEELGAQILEMPFQGGDLSLLVMLPETSVDETLRRFSVHNLRGAMDDMFPSTVNVALPKFTVEYETDLKEVLSTLGLRELFSSAADLSGFFSGSSPGLGAATHKAYIDVNEEGSEAAAATALVEFRMARPLGPSQFICDRPFLFFIYDNLSDMILFMGSFKKPAAHRE